MKFKIIWQKCDTRDYQLFEIGVSPGEDHSLKIINCSTSIKCFSEVLQDVLAKDNSDGVEKNVKTLKS